MLTADEVMPLLLAACPSFGSTWTEVEIENQHEDAHGGRLHFIDAGDFVRHLVGLRLQRRTGEFEAVFTVIERLIVEGDDYVQNLGVVGYLEGMQMMTVTAAGLDPEVEFRPYCLPESERYWAELNSFWAGEGAGLRQRLRWSWLRWKGSTITRLRRPR